MMLVPLGVESVAHGFFVGQQLRAGAVLELFANFRLLFAILMVERLARLGLHQSAHHRHGARSIDDVNRFMLVGRRDLYRRVTLAGGGAADEQRNLQATPRHLAGDMGHFIQRRRDQTAETDNIGLLFNRRVDDLVRRHHDAEIDDIVVIAAQHDADDIFADVVDVAFDRGEDQLGAPGSILRLVLFRLEKWRQIGHGFFHHPRALHHLRQEHLAGTEQIADDVHAVHQRPFDDAQRLAVLLPRLFDVLIDEIGESFNQRVRQAFFHRAVTPGVILDRDLAFFLHCLGEGDQPLSRIGAPVEQNIFDQFEQVRGNFFVHPSMPGLTIPMSMPALIA